MLDSPDVSVDLNSDMSNLSISVIQEEPTDSEMTTSPTSTQSNPNHPYHSLPNSPTPRPRLHNLLPHPATHKPASKALIRISKSYRYQPYSMKAVRERTPEPRERDFEERDSSTFSSPVLVTPREAFAPRPRSPTPHRMSSRSVTPLNP